MNTAKRYSCGKIVRPLLLMLLHFCIVCDAAWCQAGPPPPYWSAAPRYKLSPSPNFWPQSDRPVRSARPKAINVQIPEPENVTIGEEYAKGSIVIINHERKLYFVEEVGNAVRYPVAIGSPADEWQGVRTITAKRENPTWYPPIDIQIETDVPAVVLPGPHNPLGPRALYLGDTLYRIHGTNRPGSIGEAVSHGCFRMFNQHIVALYEKVQIDAQVYVVP
jgi:lipoprotein-anchoring transpeptidase ErfK/SrfK